MSWTGMNVGVISIHWAARLSRPRWPQYVFERHMVEMEAEDRNHQRIETYAEESQDDAEFIALQ